MISLLLTVLSLGYAVYTHFKTLRTKKPVYNLRSISIMKKNPQIEKLNILYANRSIENLMVTSVAFWNSGKETINFQDMVPRSPLLIESKEGTTILEVQIIDAQDSNNFLIKKINDTTYHIIFDYLDFNDGVIFKIFHDSYSFKGFNILGHFLNSEKLQNGITKDTLMDKMDFNNHLNEYRKRRIYRHERDVLLILQMVLLPIYFVSIIILLPLNFFKNLISVTYPKKYNLDNYWEDLRL